MFTSTILPACQNCPFTIQTEEKANPSPVSSHYGMVKRQSVYFRSGSTTVGQHHQLEKINEENGVVPHTKHETIDLDKLKRTIQTSELEAQIL